MNLTNITLIIPTHKRVHRQATLGAIPDALRDSVVLVSSLPEETKELKKLYPKNTVLTAKGTTNIAEKRHWIMQNIPGRVLLMMDDDMNFYQRCPAKHRVWLQPPGKPYWLYQVKPSAPKSVTLIKRVHPDETLLLKMFQDVDDYVGKNDVKVLGIAHRRHSDKVKADWKMNHRMMYAFGIDKEVYKKEKIRFDAVKLREDFHVVLSLAKKGYISHSYMELLVNENNSFGSVGGCSEERDMALSDSQCDVLAALHPGFVKVVERPYKQSLNRKEVVIAWKKAYDSSKVRVVGPDGYDKMHAKSSVKGLKKSDPRDLWSPEKRKSAGLQ